MRHPHLQLDRYQLDCSTAGASAMELHGLEACGHVKAWLVAFWLWRRDLVALWLWRGRECV
jgi:hypothetical protein